MTRREAVLSAGLVFIVALAVRAFFASQIVFPKPEDTAYYVGVARNLLEGRGLVSDALWSYGTPPLVFPRPAFEVWLPLPTLLAAIPMTIFGPSFAAAQVFSVFVGAVLPVLGWQLARDVAAERAFGRARVRWVAFGTGLTSAAYLPLILNSALPDSTMLFGAFALAACLLMSRLARDPAGARATDPRLLALGILLGFGALTRNEAVWLALIWVVIAWRAASLSPVERLRLIAVVAIVSFAIFAPWAYRNLDVFGTALPSQAISNALHTTGHDLFAWNHPPTLERHLALGLDGLIALRVEGLGHNLINVLLLLGMPVSVVGLLSLPWQGRGSAIRPLMALSLITFLVTSLLFSAQTQWGTFLHAAAPVHVLLVLSAVLAIDAGLAYLGRRLGWTKDVGWVGAVGLAAVSLLFSGALLPSFGSGSRATAATYEELGVRMAKAGHPLDAAGLRVISNFPIWVAETQRVATLALPDEPPVDVLHLAATFPGTRYLILTNPEGKHWPGDLEAGLPGAECFSRVDLGAYAGAGTDPLGTTDVYEIRCPGNAP
jgi:hypothetical protein